MIDSRCYAILNDLYQSIQFPRSIASYTPDLEFTHVTQTENGSDIYFEITPILDWSVSMFITDMATIIIGLHHSHIHGGGYTSDIYIPIHRSACPLKVCLPTQDLPTPSRSVCTLKICLPPQDLPTPSRSACTPKFRYLLSNTCDVYFRASRSEENNFSDKNPPHRCH